MHAVPALIYCVHAHLAFVLPLLWADGFLHRGCSETACVRCIKRNKLSRRVRESTALLLLYSTTHGGGGGDLIHHFSKNREKTQKKGKSRRREGRKVDKCGENNARVDTKRWRKRCGDAVRWLMRAHCSVGLLAATVALLPLTLCNGALSPVALWSFATSATSPFRKLWDAYSWWKRWIGLTWRLICDSRWMRHFSVNQLRWDSLVLNEACLMRHSFHSFHFQLHLLLEPLLNNYKANHWNTLTILNIMGMKDDISHIFSS